MSSKRSPDPKNRQVIFLDRANRIVKSYNAVVLETKELSAAGFAMVLLQLKLSLAAYKQITKTFQLDLSTGNTIN